jgi:hypothetical protein
MIDILNILNIQVIKRLISMTAGSA